MQKGIENSKGVVYHVTMIRGMCKPHKLLWSGVRGTARRAACPGRNLMGRAPVTRVPFVFRAGGRGLPALENRDRRGIGGSDLGF